jgi:hypothetical protein
MPITVYQPINYVFGWLYMHCSADAFQTIFPLHACGAKNAYVRRGFSASGSLATQENKAWPLAIVVSGSRLGRFGRTIP